MLFGYDAAVAVCVVTFVRCYEQLALTRRFGAQYEDYRRSVPGSLPRPRPSATKEPDGQAP